MAGPTIDVAFVKQYESEVHQAYQRMGSMCRGTVRTKNGLTGLTTTFQKVGKGAATTKARHGEIPPMNLEHTNVTCTVTDHFAGDYIDKFDELKINHDEREVVTNASAMALGRKTDELILDAAATTTNSEGGTGLISLKRILAALEILRRNDVPFDGQLYGWLTPKAEAELLNSTPQFTNSDWIQQNQFDSPYKVRDWLNVKWMTHSGLPGVGTAAAQCMIWHKPSLGHAIGAEVESDIQWIGPRHSHWVSNAMSQGACMIDSTAVIKIPVNDTLALS